jgi:hypothetical protein
MRVPVVAVGCLLLVGGAKAQVLHDTFDASTLDPKKWLTMQIRPDQIRFNKPGRCGPAASGGQGTSATDPEWTFVLVRRRGGAPGLPMWATSSGCPYAS